jgi:hypothetical protein
MERFSVACTLSTDVCYLTSVAVQAGAEVDAGVVMPFPADDGLPPIHSGTILGDDLKAMGWSAGQFTAYIGVPQNAVNEFLTGKCGVTAPMALRFGKAFGTGPRC